MGQKITLSETFTGSGLPTVYDDSIMGAGSLILHDVGHSLGGFSGIPGNGAAIPNIAWTTANALVGLPGQSALSGVVTSSEVLVPGLTGSTTFPFAERTSRGGLHIVRSQQSDLNGKQYLINAATAIRDYMYANSTNAFYYSVWQYYTRGATTRGTPYPGVAIFGVNTGNAFIALQPWEVSSPAGTQQPFGNYLGYGFSGTLGITGNGGYGYSFWQGGVNRFSGNLPGASSGLACIPFIWGGSGGPYNGYPHAGASQIFYRCYLEDLTYSASRGGYAGGASISVPARYAEVAARDLALYNAATGTGGRFAGDSSSINLNLYP
jgi:hypothetical protein